jgi:hypothetical protein
MEHEELIGGRDGSIYRVGGHVVRPSDRWSKAVHGFLQFVNQRERGFVPEPLDLNERTESLSYVAGTVNGYPLPEHLLTDSVIASSARLLRKLHAYGQEYVQRLKGSEVWMLPTRSPIETMCHGDFAPYNVAMSGSDATGIIDFDTLHPGPRIWDVCYAVYRWVPLKNPDNPDSYQALFQQVRRAKVFLDAYGAGPDQRSQLVVVLTERLRTLIRFMNVRAEAGDVHFQKNIADGHHRLYEADIEYLEQNSGTILSGLK